MGIKLQGTDEETTGEAKAGLSFTTRITLVALASFIIGIAGGRELMKYEIRTAVKDAFQKGFNQR